MISKDISRLISWLRFPLMFGVVMIHSGLSVPDGYDCLKIIEDICTKTIPAFCVPMFMIIAGYLFFVKVVKFTPPEYLSKLKSRTRSLVVPYLFWNAFVILIFWAMHRFVPSMINPEFENISQFSFWKLMDCFWAGSGGQPIAFQFWFIRDLIVFVIISPIFYLLFRRTWIAIALFSVIYLFDVSPWIWLAYFFALGAWVGLQKIDIMKFAKKWGSLAFIIMIVSFLGMYIWGIPGCRQIYILSAIISILAFGPKISRRIHVPKILEDASFFLFCIHALPLLMIEKISSSILSGKSEIFYIVDYFFNPIAITLLVVGIYWLLKRIFPKFTSIITGGR